jgi:hypothetical protein
VLVSKFHVASQAAHALLATVTSISPNKTFNNIQNSVQMLIVIIIIIILKRIHHHHHHHHHHKHIMHDELRFK